MTIRNTLIEALESLGPPAKIIIGATAWDALKADPEAIHDICLADDKLFFRGVEIDPFADIDTHSWGFVEAAQRRES